MGREAMSFDAELSLPAYFRTRVAAHGGRIAIGTGDWRPTYAELDVAANRFAHALIRSGGEPGDCIAILMRHDGPQIAALLAALKVGATVIVLNRTDPPARLRAIIASTEPTLIVTDADSARFTAEVWQAGSSVMLFDPHEARGSSQDPTISLSPHATAFLMYTSGSSGQPKIVMQTHRFVLHNALRHTVTQRLQPDDRIALLAALSGAQGMGTAWSALANGASLFLHATMEKGVADLASWLNHHQITIYVSASSVHRHFMRTLDDQSSFPSVRLVQITSEWATAEDFRTYQRHFLRNCEFIHGLGSSETGNVTRMRLVHGDVVEDGRLPIGQPSEGMDVLIVDEAGRPVAPGETGEMMVRSRYLTGGYWRDETLTRERFSRDPTSGMMTYRGGDLARVNARGLLEFMGRKDASVKVGGFHVDPSTVEAALLQLACVERAAVVPWNRPNGEAQLAAYLLLRAGQKSSAAAIRQALRDILPWHMVPPVIRFPDAIPLTPQGKVDRERLKQDPPGPSVNGQAEPPATATEALVAEAWLAEFDVDQIGRHDDFFDLGGDSLIAAVVGARLQDALGIELSLGMFTEYPSVAEFAAAIDRVPIADKDSQPPLVRVSRDGPLPLSLGQERIWDDYRTTGQSTNYVMAYLYQLIGPLDADVLQQCISEMARRHEMLRTSFSLIEGQPVQIVHPPSPIPLPMVDLTGTAAPEDEAAALSAKDVELAPDLVGQPTLQFRLFKINGNEHWLSRISHHIISDAWSWRSFFSELDRLYAARIRGKDFPLPETNALDYCDYAVWQRRHFDQASLASHKSFKWWKDEFAIKCEPPELPFVRANLRPNAAPSEGHCRATVGQEVTRRLDELGRQEHATSYAVRLSAFAALLAAATGQPDALIGSYIANRRSLATQRMFGFFSNFAPIRVHCRPQMTFRELLSAVSEKTAAVYSASDIPFGALSKEMSKAGTTIPNTKVIFGMTGGGDNFNLGNLAVTNLQQVRPDLMPWGFSLAFTSRHDEGEFNIRFNAALYDPTGVRKFADDLCRFCDAVSRRPDQSVAVLLAESGAIWNGNDRRSLVSRLLQSWPRRA